MKTKRGFTLIELLVVLAIIGILISIVVPRMSTYIARGKMTKAAAEIDGIETALTKLLSDAQRSDFRQIFTAPGPQPWYKHMEEEELVTANEMYTDAFYMLLKLGRNADTDADWPLTGVGAANVTISLDPSVKDKLGTQYMDLGRDPWGNLYQFFVGPWKSTPDYPNNLSPSMDDVADRGKIPFFAYRTETGIPGGAVENDGFYVDPTNRRYGFPAPINETVYVWSNGQDMECNQWFDAYYDQLDPEFRGGGDDINSWDKTQSWSKFYSE